MCDLRRKEEMGYQEHVEAVMKLKCKNLGLINFFIEKKDKMCPEICLKCEIGPHLHTNQTPSCVLVGGVSLSGRGPAVSPLVLMSRTLLIRC